MKKTYKELVDLIKGECKEHGVKVEMRDTSYVKIGSLKCGGYFCPETLRIVVAGNDQRYKAVLLHEYGHFKQWLKKSKIFSKATEKSLNIVHKWLNGDEYKKKYVKKHIDICRDMELDNEKRISKLADKYDIGMSREKYTKLANACIISYNFILTDKEWTSIDMDNKKLIKSMSGKYDMNYNKVTRKIRKAFEIKSK